MGELATCPTRQHATYRNPSIGPAMTATIAIKLTERNARVSFKLTARTMVNRRKACRSESKKQYGNQLPHLITLSARASTLGGIVRPICLAAFRLMMNSNFIGCSTGRSAGFAPFRILSTYVAARRYKSSKFVP
jgi:hypothetical protein